MSGNKHTGRLIRFIPQFRELRLSWPMHAFRGQGVRDFVKDMLPDLRRNNPNIKYMLQPTPVDCDPWLIVRYEPHAFRKYRLNFKTKYQILCKIEELAIGGDFRPRNNNIRTLPSFGYRVRENEEKGTDIFKVFSKRNL